MDWEGSTCDFHSRIPPFRFRTRGNPISSRRSVAHALLIPDLQYTTISASGSNLGPENGISFTGMRCCPYAGRSDSGTSKGSRTSTRTRGSPASIFLFNSLVEISRMITPSGRVASDVNASWPVSGETCPVFEPSCPPSLTGGERRWGEYNPPPKGTPSPRPEYS